MIKMAGLAVITLCIAEVDFHLSLGLILLMGKMRIDKNEQANRLLIHKGIKIECP